jgi:hypothetical protein
MYRLSCSIILLALAGCASTGPNEGRPREDLVTVGSQDGRTLMLPLKRDDYVAGGTIDAPRETLWPLLPLVYEELGLPAPGADRSIWTVAVQNHTAMRRIGGERISTLLDCGRDLTGAHADTHRIRLSVRTWLEPAAEGTSVNTRVEASASSTEGRAGSFSCNSRGELEFRIANALMAHSAR